MDSHELNFFNNIAPHWDRNETRSVPARINPILDRSDIEAGHRVLDLGTGTGVLVPYLLERVGKQGHVTAVDASPGMLEVARSKYGSLTEYEMFVEKDFEEEDIDGTFNRILLYCVYPHLKRPVETLRRLLENNLEPGGRIIIAFPSDETFINNIHRERKVESDMLPPAQVLASRLSEAGFEASDRSLGPDGYVVSIKKPKTLCHVSPATV